MQFTGAAIQELALRLQDNRTQPFVFVLMGGYTSETATFLVHCMNCNDYTGADAGHRTNVC